MINIHELRTKTDDIRRMQQMELKKAEIAAVNARPQWVEDRFTENLEDWETLIRDAADRGSRRVCLSLGRAAVSYEKDNLVALATKTSGYFLSQGFESKHRTAHPYESITPCARGMHSAGPGRGYVVDVEW